MLRFYLNYQFFSQFTTKVFPQQYSPIDSVKHLRTALTDFISSFASTKKKKRIIGRQNNKLQDNSSLVTATYEYDIACWVGTDLKIVDPRSSHAIFVQPREILLDSFQETEAAVRRCSSKKVALKISQYSHENTCVGVTF